MKATWCRDNEYSEMYENAESFGADKLAGPRSLVNGLVLAGAFWLMALSVWAWVKFGRYFA